jgi:hypothetical protein
MAIDGEAGDHRTIRRCIGKDRAAIRAIPDIDDLPVMVAVRHEDGLSQNLHIPIAQVLVTLIEEQAPCGLHMSHPLHHETRRRRHHARAFHPGAMVWGAEAHWRRGWRHLPVPARCARWGWRIGVRQKLADRRAVSHRAMIAAISLDLRGCLNNGRHGICCKTLNRGTAQGKGDDGYSGDTSHLRSLFLRGPLVSALCVTGIGQERDKVQQGADPPALGRRTPLCSASWKRARIFWWSMTTTKSGLY